jgi:hypothetical protein
LARRSSAADAAFGRFAGRAPEGPKGEPNPLAGGMARIMACAAPAQTAIIAPQACCVSGSVR